MRFKRMTAIVLIVLTLLCFTACSNKAGGYIHIDADLGSRTLSVGCRENDPLLDTLIAALQVRAADGTITGLSQKWFGRDVTDIKADANALSGLEVQPRTLFLGYDASAFPLAGTNAEGEAEGFEIELAASVCQLLGWELRCIPVDMSAADVELASGNVDCVWGGAAISGVGNIRYMRYIETMYVVVSNQDAPIKRIRALKEKALSYPTFAQKAAADSELLQIPETAAKLESTEACFTALNAGRCDAVLTDALAAAHYSK